MTTFAFPSLTRRAPFQMDWVLQANTQAFSSPLSRSVQTYELPGARWKLSLSYLNMRDPDAAILQAFLVRLRGRANRFTVHNMARPRPRGLATGTPLVKGGNQVGNQLLTDGWSISTPGILRAGDLIGVNGELKMITVDVTSNGSGEATLVFDPPSRSSPDDNAVITTNKPTAVFMLDDDATSWNTRPPVVSDFQIVATEAWA